MRWRWGASGVVCVALVFGACKASETTASSTAGVGFGLTSCELSWKATEQPADDCAIYADTALCFASVNGADPIGLTAHEHERLADYCRLQITAPGSSITSVTLQACVAALNSAPGINADDCSAAGQQDDNGIDCVAQLVNEVCNMPAGTLAAGAACRFNQQCKTNFCFSNNGENQCGVCTERAPVGAVCIQTAVNETPVICAAGSTCDAYTGGSTSCVALSKPGESCAPNGCYPITGNCGDAGTCVAWTAPFGSIPVGGTCDATFQCSPGLLCDETCKQAQIGSVGEPCGKPSQLCNASQCLNLCGGQECTGPDQSSAAFVCAAYIADGAACTSSLYCEPLASCIGGTCQLDPAACK